MDAAFVQSIVVWAALGLGVASVSFRIAFGTSLAPEEFDQAWHGGEEEESAAEPEAG